MSCLFNLHENKDNFATLLYLILRKPSSYSLCLPLTASILNSSPQVLHSCKGGKRLFTPHFTTRNTEALQLLPSMETSSYKAKARASSKKKLTDLPKATGSAGVNPLSRIQELPPPCPAHEAQFLALRTLTSRICDPDPSATLSRMAGPLAEQGGHSSPIRSAYAAARFLVTLADGGEL